MLRSAIRVVNEVRSCDDDLALELIWLSEEFDVPLTESYVFDSVVPVSSLLLATAELLFGSLAEEFSTPATLTCGVEPMTPATVPFLDTGS